MTTYWLVALAGVSLVLAVGLLVTSNSKLKKQNLLIRLQSKEIEKQIRELIHQNQQSEQLVRERKQLVLLVSHDLKGPFNRIFALLQLLEMESTSLSSEQKEYVGKMYQIIGDGLNMVRNLVDVRKLEERGFDPQPEPLDITSVVTAIVSQYRITGVKKSIRVHLEAPGNVEFITDRNYLSRIVENLLSNAIKFSSGDKDVFVNIIKSETEIEISVRDEGPGISAEDQLKLYQRFQKLTARPTGGETSTGLGLSIVKQLLSSMGGSITCTSELDKGSTFRIRIPEMELSSAQGDMPAKFQLNK
jgi:signal transduction histidine kinase